MLTMSSYFNGQFSDFSIICGEKEYRVHRCFIAPQSRYFERACNGMFRESAEHKIELHGDCPELVDRMIHYFYNFDYYDCDIEETKCPDNMAASAHTQVEMYCTADKYDVPGLRALALEKLKKATSSEELCYHDLVFATRATTKAQVPDSDKSLSDILTGAWLSRGCIFLSPQQDPEELTRLMTDAPWLSVALNLRVLRNLKHSKDAIQGTCTECKTSIVEEVGDRLLMKCSSCKRNLSYKHVTVMTSEVLVEK